MNVKLPAHAIPFLGPNTAFDWSKATWRDLALAGLLFGGVTIFDKPKAIILTADFDVDIDGPGGDLKTDRYWQGETSLRTAAGASCDSRQFPGYVMAPAYKDFGVKLGDFGFAYWGRRRCAFQIYDTGPTTKAGEGSIYLARALGIVKPSQSDNYAASKGNNVTDVSVVIFPGSAPGTGEAVANHALPKDLIEPAAAALLLAA